MKIACISLGCPKNQVDLDVMVHILLSAGHETVADLAEADVILVNTCGFIESAKTEAIENILEACAYKQQNPNLKVIVTGCLAERYRSQIEEEIPEVDAVVGCASNKAMIPSWSGCSTARIIWKATAPKRTSRWAASASSARPPTMRT